MDWGARQSTLPQVAKEGSMAIIQVRSILLVLGAHEGSFGHRRKNLGGRRTRKDPRSRTGC